MAVDSATTIAGFDTTLPAETDKRSEGAGNIRHIKTVVKTAFPNFTGSTTATPDDLDLIAGFAATGKTVESFASGTNIVFYNDAAPTGWTINQNVDESAVRLSKGSGNSGVTAGTGGGTHNFSTVFTSVAESGTAGVGDHTLTVSEMPAHTHDVDGRQTSVNNTGSAPAGTTGTGIADKTTTSAGGGGAHSHTVDRRVKWAACIICGKD